MKVYALYGNGNLHVLISFTGWCCSVVHGIPENSGPGNNHIRRYTVYQNLYILSSCGFPVGFHHPCHLNCLFSCSVRSKCPPANIF